MRIAIVGATGMVGQSFIKILEEYHLEYDELVLFASEKSAGKRLMVNGEALIVQALTEHSFDSGFDFALFSAGEKFQRNTLQSQLKLVVL